MKYVISIVALVVMVLGVGCAAFSYYVTPAELDTKAIDYAVDANVIQAEDMGGYPNLLKADKLASAVDSAHELNQFEIQKQMESDNLKYSQIKEVVSSNLKTSQAMEEMLFSETGLLSTGLSMVGFGTLTGLIGLMRKRPGDATADELKKAVTTATSGVTAEKMSKELALSQVVSSVQKFLDTASPEIAEKFKAICDATQDTSTQVAVAEIKASA